MTDNPMPIFAGPFDPTRMQVNPEPRDRGSTRALNARRDRLMLSRPVERRRATSDPKRLGPRAKQLRGDIAD
jgi:hypothetical protein